LRHTGAVALENGWFGPAFPREYVQAILGHASMQQTEHYTGGAGEAMLRAARAFEAAGRQDQIGISEATSVSRKPMKQAKISTTAQRTPCFSDSSIVSGASVSSDPNVILRAAVESFARLGARHVLTSRDAVAFLETVMTHLPEPWDEARLALAEQGAFVLRRALAVARRLHATLPAAVAPAAKGGRS
jgi:hypothetical protein